jgi:transposase-like protein
MGTFRTRAQKGYAERHEITLKAIEILADYHPSTSITELAKEHGITRQAVYQYVHVALDDPEGRLAQAEAEVEFRREVFKLVRGRANSSRAADRSILPAVATPGLADEPPHHDDHV